MRFNLNKHKINHEFYHDFKQEGQKHIRCNGSSTVGVEVVAHVVEDEVAEVGEEVIVREVVAASSRASALPKNLIAPLPYRITRGGVPKACCPFFRCTSKKGMKKTCLAAQ